MLFDYLTLFPAILSKTKASPITEPSILCVLWKTPGSLFGERKNNIDIKESSIKLADYSEESKRKLMRNMNYLFIGGTIAGIIYMVLLFNDLDNNFFGGLCVGIMFGMMIVGVIITSRYGFVMREKKLSLIRKLTGKQKTQD